MTHDLGLLILRVGLAVGLMTHGWGKVVNLLAGNYQFGDPLGIGPLPSLVLSAAAEFLFALLVLVGLGTRWTAIPPTINMAVALVFAHAGDPFARKELAFVYFIGFAALIFLGGGRYALDALFHHRRPRIVATPLETHAPAHR